MCNTWNNTIGALTFCWLSCFCPQVALSYDESRLWLPLSHEKLYLKLKQATQSAENLERCLKVLESTVDLEKSTSYTPFFKVLCRQPNGRTYTEIVDGTTFHTLTTIVPVKKELSAQEVEAKRLESLRLKEEARMTKMASHFALCAEALNEKTQLMLELNNLFDETLTPKLFDEKNTHFIMDFDAEDPSKNPLRYRAFCTISSKNSDSQEKLELKVRRRPKE